MTKIKTSSGLTCNKDDFQDVNSVVLKKYKQALVGEIIEMIEKRNKEADSHLEFINSTYPPGHKSHWEGRKKLCDYLTYDIKQRFGGNDE